MLKKTITYNDYNGVERKDDFYFNLTQAEVTEMELSVNGGLAEQIQKIVNAKDTPSIIKIFKELILKAYGEKTDDGKRFRKVNDNGVSLSIAFSETEAYSKLFMELATDDIAAAEFVKGIIPANLNQAEVLKAQETAKTLTNENNINNINE
jgi:hypothetical protein|nr:MAG TPA: hypothetical protein [Caudoviricetes sp.]